MRNRHGIGLFLLFATSANFREGVGEEDSLFINADSFFRKRIIRFINLCENGQICCLKAQKNGRIFNKEKLLRYLSTGLKKNCD